MDFTPNLNLPIPNADAVPPKNISEQFPDLAIALTMLDEIVHNLQVVVAGKADTDHSQAMSTIIGLVEALAAKMPANQTFSLDSLTDVQGAAEALVNYVLVKNASGFWVPSTALAALGVHNHAISEVVGLADLLTEIDDALAALDLIKANKTITITGGGLASGGGDLSGNRVITVTKATDVEAQARSRDDVAVSPKGVGLAIVSATIEETISLDRFTGVTTWVKTGLGAFKELSLEFDLAPTASNSSVLFQFSADGGATWLTTASYGVQRLVGVGASPGSSVQSLTGVPVVGGNPLRFTGPFAGANGGMRIKEFNTDKYKHGRVDNGGIVDSSGSSTRIYDLTHFELQSTQLFNAIRMLASTAVRGSILLKGVKG